MANLEGTELEEPTTVGSSELVRAAKRRTCKGCCHFVDRSIDKSGPNACTHLDHGAHDCDKGRCKDYNPNGLPWPL